MQCEAPRAPSFPPQHHIVDKARQPTRFERAGNRLTIGNVLGPVKKLDLRVFALIGEKLLQIKIDLAGVGVFDVTKGPQLQLVGLGDRDVFAEILVQGGIDPGPIRARLAMDPDRILDRIKHLLGATNAATFRDAPRVDVDVHQLDAQLGALFFLKGVIGRAQVGALEVDDGLDAAPLHLAAQLPHRGLRRAIGLVRNAVKVETDEVGEVVLHEHGIKPRPDATQRGFKVEFQRPFLAAGAVFFIGQTKSNNSHTVALKGDPLERIVI